MELKLSKAQLAVLKPDVRLVEACPGAGKTRAIVARYSAGAKSSERAFALLSFTNVAVDEALRRCANIPQATQPPNFIGTFDRFIHRFVVTPMVVRKNGKPPRYVDTWSDLPSGFDTMVRHGQVNGSGLTLAYFHADAQGDVHYPSDPPAADRVYVNQMATAGRSPSELVGLAKKRIEQLLAAGIYDSEQSRLVARSILRDPSMKWLHDRLAARFEEVIIDEFQDCSAIEHEILHSLEALGIRVVVVADPDQAIYEFRQAAPSSYVEYRGKLQGTQIVHLDENWRSSPAICGLVSSLRSISARPVLSRRDDAESPHADVVYVAVGGPDYAAASSRDSQQTSESQPMNDSFWRQPALPRVRSLGSFLVWLMARHCPPRSLDMLQHFAIHPMLLNAEMRLPPWNPSFWVPSNSPAISSTRRGRNNWRRPASIKLSCGSWLFNLSRRLNRGVAKTRQRPRSG